jgi:hypothetical protein
MITKSLKKAYAFGTYKANKRCIPVEYKGVTYLSKKQCMVLNDLSAKELNDYLNNDSHSK